MKRFQTSMFAAVACALTVSVSAQTPPPSGGVTPPEFGAHKKITVTGCLERSKDSTAGDRTTFMLNNVASDVPAATGTAGTSGSEKRPAASSYRLDGEDSKLSPHVGHKIEITGTVEDRPKSATGTPAASASSADAPKMKVDTVKMIASSCSV